MRSPAAGLTQERDHDVQELFRAVEREKVATVRDPEGLQIDDHGRARGAENP